MLVYLHGLNSSGQSVKARMLREGLSPHTVLAPDYPAHRPAAAVQRLGDFFADLGAVRPAVIGSSMGGFYGQWLARRFAFSHLFLINPALTPWDLLLSHQGETMTTADGESYQITADLIEATRPFGIADPCDGVPTTLFLDRGDEVIDFRIARTCYLDCGRVMMWDGGDHAFQHLDAAMAVIRDHLDECLRVCVVPELSPQQLPGNVEAADIGADAGSQGAQQEYDEDARDPIAPPAANRGDVTAQGTEVADTGFAQGQFNDPGDHSGADGRMERR